MTSAELAEILVRCGMPDSGYDVAKKLLYRCDITLKPVWGPTPKLTPWQRLRLEVIEKLAESGIKNPESLVKGVNEGPVDSEWRPNNWTGRVAEDFVSSSRAL